MEIRFFVRTQNIKLMIISGKSIIITHLGPRKSFVGVLTSCVCTQLETSVIVPMNGQATFIFSSWSLRPPVNIVLKSVWLWFSFQAANLIYMSNFCHMNFSVSFVDVRHPIEHGL